MTKRINPLKVNPLKRIAGVFKPDTFYERKLVCNLAVLFFVFTDFWCMNVIWDLASSPENFIYVYSVAFACALALDVPLAIAGYAFKRHKQRLMSGFDARLILTLSIIVTLIAWLCSFAFKMVTGDMTYSIETVNIAATIGETVAETAPDSGAIITISVFAGIIPLLTSVSSFVISYFSYSPIDTLIQKYTLKYKETDSLLQELTVAKSQCPGADKYCSFLLTGENSNYEVHLERIRTLGETCHQKALMYYMSTRKTEDDIATVIDYSNNSVCSRSVNANYPSALHDAAEEYFSSHNTHQGSVAEDI